MGKFEWLNDEYEAELIGRLATLIQEAYERGRLSQIKVDALRAQRVPRQDQIFHAFKDAWEGYPSQDNEGYQPDRGGFKAGWHSAILWLLEFQKESK